MAYQFYISIVGFLEPFIKISQYIYYWIDLKRLYFSATFHKRHVISRKLVKIESDVVLTFLLIFGIWIGIPESYKVLYEMFQY